MNLEIFLAILFMEEFEQDGVSFSGTWENSPMKPSGPALLYTGSFLITDSISLLIIGLFRCSISSLVSFEFVFLETGLLYLGYPLCWYAIYSILL